MLLLTEIALIVRQKVLVTYTSPPALGLKRHGTEMMEVASALRGNKK